MVSLKSLAPIKGGLLKNVSRQVAIIFALVLVPIALVISLAIDSSRQLSTKRHVGFAADVASLAGARAMEDASITNDDVEDIAKDFYLAQLDTGFGDLTCHDPNITVDRGARTVEVSGSCDVPTIFSGLTTDEVPVGSESTAQAKVDQLELVLLLDLSASMTPAEIAELKAAAKDFVATLLNPATEDRVRIAVVPVAYTVNDGICGDRAMLRWDRGGRVGDGPDMVCVTQRQGDAQYTDAEPIVGQLVDDGDFYGENLRGLCPEAGVMALTNQPDRLTSLIDGLPENPGGAGPGYSATAGHVAFDWGWYTLSPNWHRVWPADARPNDYSDVTTKKVMILLTDGIFNMAYAHDVWEDIRAQLIAALTCEAIHDNTTIQIYAINYSPSGRDPDDPVMLGPTVMPPGIWQNVDSTVMLQNCASSDDHYFAGTPSMDYSTIFGRIAATLQKTRIVG